MKQLCVEHPYKEPQYMPYDGVTRIMLATKYGMDIKDFDILESSKIVWVGDNANIAIALEEGE